MHILICHIIHEAAKGYTKPLERTIQKGRNSLIEWESIGMRLPCALAQNILRAYAKHLAPWRKMKTTIFAMP